MKPETLLTALNDVEDGLILDVQPSVRKPSRRPRFSMLLAAAFLLSTLALTALASEEGSLWFRNFFAQEAEQPLSQEQSGYIAAHTVPGTQSQTVNGYTIALDSAISDGNRTYLQCTLTAPEGTVLDADHYGDLHGTVFQFPDPGDSYGIHSFGWEVRDDDRADNTVTLLFTHESSYSGTETVSFTDNPCQLYIYGLAATYYEGEGMDMTTRKEPLTEGMWHFEINFPEDSDREIEFVHDYAECPCQVIVGHEQTGENTLMPILESTHVQVTSFTLRSLSADFHYQYKGKDSVNADFEPFFLVMKDGTQLEMQRNAAGPNYNSYKFETPVILENVSHILLPDGTKLYP